MDIKSLLILDEGVRLKPYKDTVGKWTIGIGRNIEENPFSTDELLFILSNGFNAEAANICLDNDIKKCIFHITSEFPWFERLGDARKAVLINMCFNMGIKKLLAFKKTLKFIEDGLYDYAADGMMDSLWAKQVKGRAVRLSKMMKTGKFLDA